MVERRPHRIVGKPFHSELAQLSVTCKLANQIPVAELSPAVASARGGSVVIVGSGGSLSAAEFAYCLFDSEGFTARAVTPLTLLQSRADLRETSLFILSASGNNKDVLATFQAASRREVRQIVNVCASLRSKLAKLALDCPRARHFAFSLPSRRDGFLATNSLAATTILLARAFAPSFEFNGDVDSLVHQGESHYKQTFSQVPPKHLVILYSGWSRLAAVDLESKLSEAGLAASMLVDYRQFAHGRHNWLDKQKETAIVAFSTPSDTRLADATLARFPKSLHLARFHLSEDGPNGAIESLLNVYGFVAAMGVAMGIDPGRPGVPDYGSALYHLGPMLRTEAVPHRGFDVQAAVHRKVVARLGRGQSREQILNHANAFLGRFRSRTFGALVTDFDGTILPLGRREGPIPKGIAAALLQLLRANIPVILATGRGDSIQKVLVKQFPRAVWPRLFVGYLNGAFCLPLSHANKFSHNCIETPDLKLFEQHLLSVPKVSELAEVKNSGCQLSLRPRRVSELKELLSVVQTQIDAQRSDCRIVTSSHSIDVLPKNVSKAACIEFASKLILQGRDVLTLGDCGCQPGNDFELLSHSYSLSVDSVSSSSDTCWNFLPEGLSHAEGALFYFSHFTIRRDCFTVAPS